MKERILTIRQLTRDYRISPLMLVLAILLAAGAAKAGHGTWAIAGMLALMSFVTVRNGAALLARISRLRDPR